MDDLIKARLQMVRDQIAGRGISNSALLEAMSKVQREFFVPPHLAEFAHLDTPLPIESGQNDLAALRRRPDDRGCGAAPERSRSRNRNRLRIRRCGSLATGRRGLHRGAQWKHSCSIIRTHEPLLPGLSAATVRRIRLVR